MMKKFPKMARLMLNSMKLPLAGVLKSAFLSSLLHFSQSEESLRVTLVTILRLARFSYQLMPQPLCGFVSGWIWSDECDLTYTIHGKRRGSLHSWKDANIRKSIDERRKFITTNTGSLYLTERESDISGSKSEDYKMIGLFSYSAERKKRTHCRMLR